MKAVTYQGPGKVALSDVPEPELQSEHDALVQVEVCAICGSDLHILHGEVLGMSEGFVCGHEFTGTIVAAGTGVRGLRVGDRVFGAFHVACGFCASCRKGRFHQCRNGGVLGYGPMMGNLAGSQAELVRVPYADVNLRKIPPGVDPEAALFCGDVLTTAYGAVVNAALLPGETVAVIGCGPVGLMAVQVALHLGAAAVYAIDMIPDRLQRAEQYGAVPVNAAQGDAAATVRQATRKQGVDVVIEAVGGPKTLAQAFMLVSGGGRISALGVSNQQSFEYPLLLGLTRDIGFRIGLANIHRDIDQVLALVAAGRIDPRTVITDRMSLADAVPAYAKFDRREALKIVLRP